MILRPDKKYKYKEEFFYSTYHTAAGAVKQQAFAGREMGQLEQQNVSYGVIHGDGGRVEVAHSGR